MFRTRQTIHLQEDGCMYSYGMVCFTCITVSSLVGRAACSNTLFYLSDTLGFETCRRHQKIKNQNINLEIVRFVGLCRVIILQYTLQKT